MLRSSRRRTTRACWRIELKRIGFEVEVAEDLSKGGFHWAIQNFKKRIRAGSTALFFFSGYGLQANRQTYLIPADAQIWREADVAHEGTNLIPASARGPETTHAIARVTGPVVGYAVQVGCMQPTCLVIADHQIDRRRLTFQGTA